MTRGRPEYQLVEHTADAGILVRAPDLRLLFERSAAAMFDLLVDVDAVAAELPASALVDEIEVEAPDREALLVAWLSELLARAMLGGIAYAAFEVTALSDTRLTGVAWGAVLDALQRQHRTEIKAVTYHQLLVSQDRDGCWARVIFDL